MRAPRFLTLIVPALSLALAGCASARKPCAEGGDVSWNPTLKTNKRCTQKKHDGQWVNHGEYEERNAQGVVVLRGQFEYGLKEGLWSQYNEEGRKIAEKYFEKGVEKAYAPPPAKPGPLPGR